MIQLLNNIHLKRFTCFSLSLVLSRAYIFVGLYLLLTDFSLNEIIDYGVFFSLIIMTTELLTLRINYSQARILFENTFDNETILKGSVYYALIIFTSLYIFLAPFLIDLFNDNNLIIILFVFSFFKIINNNCYMNFKINGEYLQSLVFSFIEFSILTLGVLLLHMINELSLVNYLVILSSIYALLAIVYLYRNMFYLRNISNLWNKNIFIFFIKYGLRITLYSITIFIIMHHSRIFGQYFIDTNDLKLFVKITTIMFSFSIFAKSTLEIYRPELSRIYSVSEFNAENSAKGLSIIIKSSLFGIGALFLLYVLLYLAFLNYSYLAFLSIPLLSLMLFFNIFDLCYSSLIAVHVFKGQFDIIFRINLISSLICIPVSMICYATIGLVGLIISIITAIFVSMLSRLSLYYIGRK